MDIGAVNTILVSNCGSYVFTAENVEGEDGVAKSYEVDTARCVRTFGGHSGKVLGLAQSPDGKFLYTCGDDKTAKRFPTTIDQDPAKVSNPMSSFLHAREMV